MGSYSRYFYPTPRFSPQVISSVKLIQLSVVCNNGSFSFQTLLIEKEIKNIFLRIYLKPFTEKYLNG